ncbi:ComEC/Rec2 family competence protein [Actinomyces vulturis]|uniref:ComEC/Rec2 family competence protein n=1 Tax=Actinomyces vulturis TaxID=1857645 RepID=UPI0009F36513|nr:ComEC/Rec2 family competence protein [Actinomyces vulturis]
MRAKNGYTFLRQSANNSNKSRRPQLSESAENIQVGEDRPNGHTGIGGIDTPQDGGVVQAAKRNKAHDSIILQPAPMPHDLRLVPLAVASWLTAFLGVNMPYLQIHRVAPWFIGLIAVGTVTTSWYSARTYLPQRRRHLRREQQGTHDTLIGLSAVIMAGILSIALVAITYKEIRQADPLTTAANNGTITEITGRLVSTPRVIVTASGRPQVRVVLAVDTVRSTVNDPLHHSQQNLLVITTHEWMRLREGDVVSLTSCIEHAEPSKPYGGVIHTHNGPVLLRSPQPHSIASLRGFLRSRMQQALHCTTYSCSDHPADSLLLSVALGQTTAVPHELRTAMRSTGLAHITAVSGQHVAIVSGLWIGLLHRRSRFTRALGGGAGMLAFALIVGSSASVLRACVMGLLTMSALWGGRTRLSFPALSLAVWILILLDPWQSTNLGFQLSVLATASIMAWGKPLFHRFAFLPPWLAASLSICLSAALATAPLLLNLTSAVNMWTVPANVAASPAIIILVADAVGVLIIATLSPNLAHLVSFPGRWAAQWIVSVAEHCVGLPGSQIPWVSGAKGVMILVVVHGIFLWAIFHGPKVLTHQLKHGRLRSWQHEHGNNPPPPAPPGTKSLSLPLSSLKPVNQSLANEHKNVLSHRPGKRTQPPN